MPQVDLESLVSACAGGATDRKISCETLTDHPLPDPDSPPESFYLSKDAELDWFDRNAFYERKDSGKGNSSSANLTSNSNSNSQRFSFSLKSKAAILGLPKPQKSCFVDAKNRKTSKPGNTRLFPKRSGSGGKPEASVIEPSSPKVSCIGRVRSNRNRRCRSRNNRSSDSAPIKEKSARGGRRRTGFFDSFRAIFRPCRRHKESSKPDPELSDPPSNITEIVKASEASLTEANPRNSVSESDPPGLGGMRRFASGRRFESWGVDGDAVHAS